MKQRKLLKDGPISDLKIIYFFEWQGRADAGVVQKVQNQLTSWKNMGIGIEIIFVTSVQNAKIDFQVPTHVFEFSSSVQRLRARRNAMHFARSSRTGWIMYRRYALMTYAEIYTMARVSTVIELNTNNDIFYRNRSVIQYLWHLLQIRLIGQLSIGACAVTEEINRLNIRYFKTISTFTNGICLNSFREAKSSKKPKKLIFLAGDDFAWNGIEVLQQMATLLPDYKIDVFGINRENHYDSNIQYKEFLPFADVQAAFKDYRAGITTLLLENIGLSEAAPLKTRQYLFGGLPVIGRFRDSGFDDSFPHYFRITAEGDSKEIINQSELESFLRNCENRVIKKSDLDSIDSEQIERHRITFIREVVSPIH